jgi:outer membrane biosynthesis protein TonB
MEKQQNYRQIEQLLHEGMLQAVRSLVPVKSILKDFVHQGQEDEEEEEPQDPKAEAQKEEPQEPKVEPQAPKVEPQELKVEPQVEPQEPKAEPQKEQKQEEQSALEPITLAEPSDPFEEPTESTDPPTIVVNDKPNVRFGQFHAMFDSQDGEQSELVYDEGDVSEVPDQGTGVSLDADDLDSFDLTAAPESVDDYEEL